MRRAARTDNNQTEIVSALRAAGALVCSLAGVGQGVPDLLVSSRSRLLLLEVKDGNKVPSARKLTAAQAQWHALGWPVTVVSSIDEALAAVRVEIQPGLAL